METGEIRMIRELLVWLDKRLGRSKKKIILRPRNYGNK
jgi:hypothetical protein